MRPKVGKGLSLVELMIAVSILAIGITATLRSFIGALSALDATSNRLAAMQILEEKMVGVEQALRQGPDSELSGDQGDVMVGQRPGRWVSQVEKIDEVELVSDGGEGGQEGDGQEGGQGEPEEKAVLYEVAMTVTWQENNIDKKASLATYFYQRQPQQAQ
ncbi:MAG: prepilin-type N-terminal cleavage/methylation domain-containing protein [Candidatus Omnitrophota bacterium]